MTSFKHKKKNKKEKLFVWIVECWVVHSCSKVFGDEKFFFGLVSFFDFIFILFYLV